MALDVSWSRTDGTLVATLAGRIDSANSTDCMEALEAGIGPDDRSLVLNLADLTYIGSAGLRVLLLMAKRFTGPGQTFSVCHPLGPIHEVIKVSGFSTIIPVHATLADALATARGPGGAPADAGDDAAPSEAAGSPALRDPFDMDAIGDNIEDVALFTIEKHEFVHGSLADDVRSEAYKAISDLLWDAVRLAQERRRRALARLFKESEEALDKVVARHAG